MPSKYAATKATPNTERVLYRVHRGPSARHVNKANVETQEILMMSTRIVEVLNQCLEAEMKGQIQNEEVRCFRSSGEVR